MANQNIHQGDLNDHSIRPTWGTIEKQDDTNKEDRFIAIVESISRTVANKSNIGHIHDDRYYTEEEIDAMIAGVDSRIQNVDDVEASIEELTQDLNDTKTEIDNKIRDLYANKADSNHTHSYLPLTGGTLSNALTVQTGGIVVQGGSSAGGNNTRLNLTSGIPDAFPYNQSKRGTKIYSNGIAFADPFNGNSNNDAGWIRHIEETANSGTLEIAVGDDGNESVVVRQYNTSSAVVRTLTLLDSSGNTTIPGVLNIYIDNTTSKAAVYDALRVRYKSSSGTFYNATPIRYIGTDASDGYNPTVIFSNGGGTTIVGAGESATSFSSKNNIYNDEILYLVSDDHVRIYSGVSNEGVINGYYYFPALGSGKVGNMSQAITNITKSGSTYTATRANGTTFTF